MADDDSGGQYFDPAASLSPDDPLRDSSVDQWIAKVQADHPDIAGQLLTDPSAAVKALADRGVAPPPMSYAAGDSTGSASPLDMPVPNTGPHGIPSTSPFGRMGIGQTPDPTANQGPYVMNKGPATGVTPPGSTPPDAVIPPSVPMPRPRPVVGASALDPEEGEPNPSPVAPGAVPLPTPKPTDTDVSAKKKTTGDNGMADFAKTLAGVKALQPPLNAAVGTPSVHSALAMKSPDITQLLALFGQQAGAATPASTLGRLLVAGKA